MALLCLLSPRAWALDEAEVAREVDRHLGLYLAVPDRRERSEGVRLEGDGVELWFLRPVKRPERDEAACDALRWLLRGRLVRNGGIRALFVALPDLREVTLVFYAVETRVEPDAAGRYQQTRNAAPHARVSIRRERASTLDPEGLKTALVGAGCAERGRELVDLFWVK